MLLLFKYYYNIEELKKNKIILYALFLLIILYFSKTLFTLICITDIYLYNILTNFNIISTKITNKDQKESGVKMEIVAEGVTKKETDNLLNTLIEYSEKFNKQNK